MRLIARLRNQSAIEKRCEHHCFQEDMSHENTMYGIRKVRYGTIKRTVPRHQRGKLSRKSRSISLSVPFKSCDKRSKDARIMRQQNGQNWGVSCIPLASVSPWPDCGASETPRKKTRNVESDNEETVFFPPRRAQQRWLFRRLLKRDKPARKKREHIAKSERRNAND